MADEQQEAIEFDGLSNEGTADESETELAEAAEDGVLVGRNRVH
jgi:hypothetical protein